MELLILGGVAAGFVCGVCGALWIIAALTGGAREESDTSEANRARR